MTTATYEVTPSPSGMDEESFSAQLPPPADLRETGLDDDSLTSALADVQDLDALTTSILQPPSILQLTSPSQTVVLQPISLDALVALIVERNLDYQISQVNYVIAGEEITAQKGIFDPLISGFVEQSEVSAQGSIFNTLGGTGTGLQGTRQASEFQLSREPQQPDVRRQQNGGELPPDVQDQIQQLLDQLQRFEEEMSAGFQSDYRDVTRRRTKSAYLQVTELLPLGGTIGAGYTWNRNWQEPAFLNINPSYSQNGSVWVVQPVPFFRNWGPDVTLSGIRLAKKNLETREWETRNSLLNQIAAVKQAYWDLLNAIYTAEVQRLSLLSAQNLLRINQLRLKYEVGTEIDVWESRAGVASRQSALIQASEQIGSAVDSLSRLTRINEGKRDWKIWLIPDGVPEYDRVTTDEEQYIAEALDKRPDIRQAELSRERAKIRRKVARNQRMPQLDLFASYGMSGLGPTLGEAGSNLRTQDYDNWSFGLDLSYPIPNRAARARYRQSQKLVEGSDLVIEQVQDLAIFEVRNAIRRLETAWRVIDASRTQVRAEQEKLRGQIKRYEVGISTSQRLLEYQDDLAAAQSRLIAAVAAYNQAVIELDRARGILLEKHGIQISVDYDTVPYQQVP